MKYAFVKENQKSWSIGLQCRVLQVSRPGYYAWLNLATSQRQQAKKFKRTTDSNHDKPIAENLLDQDFSVTAPNQK
jgi:hypothetical protein